MNEIRGDGAEGRSGNLRATALSAYGPTLLGSTGAGAVSPIVAVSARELGASVGVAALLAGRVSGRAVVLPVGGRNIDARLHERIVARQSAASPSWPCAA